jgi:hypothetical protein
VQTPFACGQGFAPTPSASALSLSPLAGAVGPRCRGLECNYTVTVNRKDYGLDSVNEAAAGPVSCIRTPTARNGPRPIPAPFPLATRQAMAARQRCPSHNRWQLHGWQLRWQARRNGSKAPNGGRAATCCRWQHGVSKGAWPLGLRHGQKAMASRLKCCRPLSPEPPLPDRAGPGYRAHSKHSALWAVAPTRSRQAASLPVRCS